ncbi:Platinum sensitivity protein [Vanrija albida]|uniref:Platinum sensitivity protein n=1 Tax=Vanrija albida TaxID=181172 RepID=A0ABR3Q4K9_9TREE
MANLEPTQSSADVLAEQVETGPAPDTPLDPAPDSSSQTQQEADNTPPSADDGSADAMDVQSDINDESNDEMLLSDAEQNIGKRVKVYELRDQAWFDRGTGHCKGVYDDQNDVALLIVEAEDALDENRQPDDPEGPGGFLKDELLLNAQVSKDDVYTRQQETLIVWTDQATQQDIALSFQDPEGCEDIWQFLMEVQKHLNNQLASSSSPLAASPLLGGHGLGTPSRDQWQSPSLANIKEHEMWLRMQAKSAAGRERAVEHIIGEDYIKQLIGVLSQAEDLESINDLHALCSLMQTILMFNDNGIFEYILQDDIFMGVLGMLEYDPEFPTLKASYRAFFRQYSKFRQVVEIKDEAIRNKIHQTSRLLYLKDVVLARMLDDPTFGILNSFVFFNQVDITTYIQADEVLLHDLFVEFRREQEDADGDPKKRDLVMFLHQLMVMGKGVQVPNRLALYRTLLDRGLLFACEWAFRQREATILHAGAEILTLCVEHDVNAVRLHVLREEELTRRTLVSEIIGLLQSTHDQGLVQQTVETLRTLLEPGPENEQTFGRAKELSVVDTFTQYFYDLCATQLFAPLGSLPDLKDQKGPPVLSSERASLLNTLIDLLSYCIGIHAHRAQFYILSNTLPQKVCHLIYAREKTLRHCSLRFIKACLKTNNHFIHRNFAKNGVTKAILDLVERETDRDTMLSSACLDTLELIRKENMKPIIVDMFDKHDDIMTRLADRPYVRGYVVGLRVRWEQYKEPPPPPPAQVAESSKIRSSADDQDGWFNQSEDETEGEAETAATGAHVPLKRKRGLQAGHAGKRQSAPKPISPALGLDYDDASDSDGSTGGESPIVRPDGSPFGDLSETQHQLSDDLSDVAQKIRAKRMREEEEEEAGGLADLVGGGGKSPAAKKESAAATKEGEGSSRPTAPTGNGKAAEGKEKKIRLSLGGLGKKLSGGKA